MENTTTKKILQLIKEEELKEKQINNREQLEELLYLLDDEDRELFEAVEYVGKYIDRDSINEIIEDLERIREDELIGRYSSFEDYAYDIFEDAKYEIPEYLHPYFDLQRFALDLEHDYSVFETGADVLIFYP